MAHLSANKVGSSVVPGFLTGWDLPFSWCEIEHFAENGGGRDNAASILFVFVCDFPADQVATADGFTAF